MDAREIGHYTVAMIESWWLLVMPAGEAAFNMAVDEVLWRSAAQRARPLLRVYAWRRPAVSFGYFQKFPAALADRYELVRRPTGGGIVYHGDGVDTTYAVVVPPGHRLHALKTNDAYHALHEAVAAALALPHTTAAPRRTRLPSSLFPFPSIQRGQYECFQNPVAGDVVAEGRKLAGGAQRRGKAGMLHQGSIAARVTAAQLAEGFQETLPVEFVPDELRADERALAEKLAVEKYATPAWNRRIIQ